MERRIGTARGDSPLETVHLRWQTFVALGVALAALGVFAMGASALATLASVLVFGWALIIGGVLQVVHAVFQRRWGGRALDVLTGVLFGVVGAMAVWRPVTSAISLTLVIAVALMIRGVFSIVAASTERFPQWGWAVGYGVISAILGLIVAAMWPEISLWLIGLIVGVELLVDGVVVAMMGLAARKAREERPGPAGRRAPSHEERVAPGEQPLPTT